MCHAFIHLLLIACIASCAQVGNRGIRVTKTLEGLAKDIIAQIPKFTTVVENLPMGDEKEEEKKGMLTTQFNLKNMRSSNFTVYLNEFANTVKTAYLAHLFQIHGNGNGFSVQISMEYEILLNKITLSVGTVAAFLRSTAFDLFQNYGTGFPKSTLHVEWSIASINIVGEYKNDQKLRDLIYKTIQYKLTNQINSYLNLKIGIIDQYVMAEYSAFQVQYPYKITMNFSNSLYNMTPSDGNTATFAYQSLISVVDRPDSRLIRREVFSEALPQSADMIECYSNEILLAILDVQAKARYPYMYMDLKSLGIPNNAGYFKNMFQKLNYYKDTEEVECGCRSNPDEEIVELIYQDNTKRVLIPIICSFAVKSIGDNFFNAHLFVNGTFSHTVDTSNGVQFYGTLNNAHFRGFQSDYTLSFFGMETMSDILGKIVAQMNGMRLGPPGISHSTMRKYNYVGFYENVDDVCFKFAEAASTE